ncbi:MAG: DUF4416 family protein [Kiritimatiellia bacterium]|jgi:hypothetical protein|nr:DUF4416 family protein [Kiritimatiellia bacterium]MDP6847379.1 DUF4416 family protein [Kiritimatiellia bacterium]
MSTVKKAKLVRLFCGIIAVSEDAMKQVEQELAMLFGPINVATGTIPFDCTHYYELEMGSGLLRKFVAFDNMIDPGDLADIKTRTNKIEQKYMTAVTSGATSRCVNLDPGYVTPAKVVLATAKNYTHRVYLSKGIFAEVTMTFDKKGCVFLDWTYPDFKTPGYTEFFLGLRGELLAALADGRVDADSSHGC